MGLGAPTVCYAQGMMSVGEESDLSDATDTVSLTVELPRDGVDNSRH